MVLLTSSWHAIGPALVLCTRRRERRAALRLAALCRRARRAVRVSTPRAPVLSEWIAFRRPSIQMLPPMATVFCVDAALAPIGLLAALAGARALALLPSGSCRWSRCSGCSRGSGGRASATAPSSSGARTAARRSCSATSSRRATSTRARHFPRGGRARARRRRRAGSTTARDATAELAALLHDVGKIRVPREIITKPSALDAAERELMKLHTIEGEQMLNRVGGLLGDVGESRALVPRALRRHGLPDGLRGQSIPLVARIVACCDAWSAMTSDRPYRPRSRERLP